MIRANNQVQQGCKIQIKYKIVIVLQMGKEASFKKMKQFIYNASRGIKYLRINLMKDNLNVENYIIPLKEPKDK